MVGMESVEKDYWDKAEVASKFIVPIVVALSGLGMHKKATIWLPLA